MSGTMSGAAGPRAAGLVLAAGAGRRMGVPKATVLVGGRRLVDRQVALLRAAECDPVVVVLGAAVVDVPGAVTVVNAEWAQGMGTSLAAGLQALQAAAGPAVTSAAVVLVDQPMLTPAAVTRTLGALGTAPAARASWAGRPGHPVVLSRRVWSEVAASAAGDAGARGWLADHAGEVTVVACDGLGDDRDVDTAADVAALERRGDPRRHEPDTWSPPGPREPGRWP